MKLLVTIQKRPPFVTFKSVDSSEKRIADLEAKLKAAHKAINNAKSVAKWATGELTDIDEIQEKVSELNHLLSGTKHFLSKTFEIIDEKLEEGTVGQDDTTDQKEIMEQVESCRVALYDKNEEAKDA